MAAGAAPGLAHAAGPDGATGVALGGRVQVAWQPVAGATAYSVYRGTSPTAITTLLTPVGGIAAPQTSFTDTTAVNGTTYYYAVRSILLGVESPNSLVVQASPVAASCTTGNVVVVENCFPGNPSWNVRSSAQMPSGIEGFATAQSINTGDSVALKVNSGSSFNIEIYRSGWYGGAGARLFSIIRAVPGTSQPACLSDSTTGLLDCSNWSTSYTLTTTSAWPSGIYLLRLVRTDNSNDNQILLVVRDDGRHPDVIYGTGMTAFQAYNNYGGKSLYTFNSNGNVTVSGTARAVKVSFDRPFEQPRSGLRDWYTNTELATVEWLERNGYDVSYVSNGDLETQPTLLQNAHAYVSPAHDEYVSAAMRTAMQNARDGGVGLFFSGSNEIYWKIRFEADAAGAANRTEVCYKTVESGGPDPSGVSTSTWRDPNGPNAPENALSGELYIGDNDTQYFPFVVSSALGQDRIWRYTGLDTQAPGTSTTIGSNLTGWEWDARLSNGAEPPGVKTLSGSPVTGELLTGNGAGYVQNQTATVSMVKYKALSGALVVTTGTNHWNRGLGVNASNVGEPDLRIQQATVNILEDMGARPATPQAGIVLDPVPGLTPAPPASVAATPAGSDSIVISWAPASGATGYNVYRTTVPRDGGYPLGSKVNAQPLTSSSVTDIGLASGQTYYYVVTSVASGVEGAPSSEASAQTVPSTTSPVRINAGGGAYTTVTGANFVADTSFSGGSTYSITQSISGTNDPALYQNERWGQFTYTIPVPNGTYDVRFHFAELYYGTAVSGSCVGKRIFGMDVLNTPTSPDIQNLDICALVGPRAALIMTVSGVQVTNGAVTVKSVYGSVDDPEVTAIEVVPAVAGPPTVKSTTPLSGATAVAISAQPTATFSRAMNASTITSSSMTLSGPGGGVPASVAYNSTTLTATLTPSAALAYSTTYTATVTTAAKSADGVALAAPVSWSFTTAPAPDTQPPSAPTNLQATGGISSVALTWVGSTDNVGVTRYDVYRSTNAGFTPSASNRIAQPTATSYTDTGLAAGTYYYLVAAEDAAGNVSASSNQANASVTGDVTPPTVSISAPTGGATVSGTVSVTATAADNVAVAGVQFRLDGANLGAEDTSSPYSVNWDTTTATNAQHTLTAVARDAAGNTTTSTTVTVTVSNTAPPPAAYLFGDQSIETTTDFNNGGQAEAFKTTSSVSGSVTGIPVYVDSTSAATKLTAGLYADGAGGHPGTLLTQGALTSPVTGWNTVSVPAASVTAGTTYWIAILSPSGTGTLRFRDRCCGKGTSSADLSSQTTLTSLAATWSSSGTFQDGPGSVYAVGTTTQAALAVAPASLSFGAVQGGASPAPAQLSVTNTGTGTLSFTASSDAPWLTAAPTSGSAPQALQVSAAVGSLAPGTYTGHVTVTSPGAQGSPAVVLVTFAVSAASTGTDWPMIEHDPARTGAATAETAISTTTASSLALSWSTAVDGKVTAQPLYLKAVQVGGQAHDVVIAATASNSIYALDASSGAVLWRRNFGAQPSNCAIPGGFGVTAAPVIDRSSGRIYTVSDDGQLHAIALADGTDAASPLPLIANASTNKVWGGLNLLGGTLYIATASDGCDTAPWRGTVYRIDVSGATPKPLGSFAIVPGIPAPNGGGGIWGYGGVSADPLSGDIFAATGADSNELYQQYADRMIAFDSRLALLGSYGPPEPSTFDCTGAPCDLDFGATPLVFQPAGCPLLVAAGNKNGNLYLERATDLAASAAPLQTLPLNAPHDSLGLGGVGGVPAWWSAGKMVFVSDGGPGISGVAAGVVGLDVQADCTLKVHWSAAIGGNGQPNSTPTIANGVVFAGEGNGGAVHAFSAATGATLWTATPPGAAATYAAPSVADGKLFVGSWNGFTAGSGGTISAYAPAAGITVAITSPSSGATASGTVNVSASTTGTVTGVQFTLDGANLSARDTTAPYSVSWDTTTATNGTHTLQAVATASSGATATSAPVTVTVQNATATKVLLGDQTVEPAVDFNNAGLAEAYQTTATTSGTLSKLSVYLDSTSAATNVVVGVYADAAGHPGTLLAQGTLAAPVNGAWNDVPIPAASITSGTTYWVALLSTSGTIRFRDRCCGKGTRAETSSQSTLTALPSTWTTGSTYSDGPFSAYGSGF